MGIIYNTAKKDPDLFQNGSFVDMPPSQTMAISDALISPGKVSVNQAVAMMTGNQLANLIKKIDRIWRSDVSTPISDMILEGLRPAITLVRTIAQVAQSATEFAGILASGQQLDIWPLRPIDIGGVYLNGAGAVAAGGIYGSPILTVRSWNRPGLVAGVAQQIIPAQTTSGNSPFGGLILFGGIEKTYTPKVESLGISLQGQPVGSVPSQPAAMSMKRTFGDDNDISLFWLEKPIFISYNTNFAISYMPRDDGFTNFELVGMMVGQVQSKLY